MRWTTEQIPDLSGRIAIVTGATSGIGLETAVELARHGATTILAARDPAKSQTAVDRIMAAHGSAKVEALPLDLTSLESVRMFASTVTGRFPRLDLLINNAGVMAVPCQRTADGFEMQLGTNHLGHFALTGLLLDSLSRSGSARVVTVSSLGHWRGRLDLDDVRAERAYDRWKAYFRSKLANVLFIRELRRRLDAAGLPILSVGAHPGLAATNLGSKTGVAFGESIMAFVNGLFAQSAAAGALPTLYAATAPDVRSGDYFGPRVLGVWGAPSRARFSPAGRRDENAHLLWDRSVELTNVDYALRARAA